MAGRPSPREAEIYEAALRLFREKGYHATSMRDIGQAVGLLKGSLYTYISSKQDLLVPIFEQSTVPLLRELERIVADPDLPAPELLRLAIRAHVATVAQRLDVLTVFLHERRALSSESLRRLRAYNKRYQDLFAGIIERGVREGVFRPVDCRVTMLALIGMCNSMAWWYRPDGRLAPDEIAEQFADLVLNGLHSPSSTDPATNGLP
jgi:TetR/AcrR family transcriptional regulator, cholesterol catabolism regulator